MNLYLHDIDSDHVELGDTLSDKGKGLGRANLILTNPPFGPAGGAPTRDDLSVTATVSSYQLPFVEHCIRALQPGGRAAIVVPDNVLFEDGRGKELRRMMMDWCDLHTILRLPTGIFYAQGVKTNVLFFTRGETDKGNTREIWVYDLRASMPQFGKRTVLTRAHFAGFDAAFGDDPLGSARSLAQRKDTGESGRFRRFTRDSIAERGDNLDIAWLKDESEGTTDELPEPAALAQEAMDELEGALEELRGILEELGEEVEA
jgi:type I restriction enzyme M protein